MLLSLTGAILKPFLLYLSRNSWIRTPPAGILSGNDGTAPTSLLLLTLISCLCCSLTILGKSTKPCP